MKLILCGHTKFKNDSVPLRFNPNKMNHDQQTQKELKPEDALDTERKINYVT